jgi:purine-binding chemotaxis protein CheW
MKDLPMDQSPESSTLAHTGNGRQYATFFVDGMFFGVEVLKVQEVLRYQEMTCVPLAPQMVQGLINLRGQIVTAIDMRHRLGLAPRNEDSQPMNVVVRSNEGAVSLLVDEIGDVIEVSGSSYEPPPVNMPAAQKVFVDGVYKLDRKLLLVLNTDRTLKIQRETEQKN